MKQSYHKFIDDRNLAVLDLHIFAKGIWRVSRINVPKPFQHNGIGTRMMKEMCKDADNENVIIILEPSPYDRTPNSYNDLVSFYKKFDFVFSERIEDYEGTMIRYPQA
jgi:tRNA(Met) C34 N-acetyltransferase TmcA